MNIESAHLSQCPRCGRDVVDCVERHPDHGSETHAESHVLGPLGVVVVLAIRHRFIGVDVEDEHTLKNIDV